MIKHVYHSIFLRRVAFLVSAWLVGRYERCFKHWVNLVGNSKRYAKSLNCSFGKIFPGHRSFCWFLWVAILLFVGFEWVLPLQIALSRSELRLLSWDPRWQFGDEAVLGLDPCGRSPSRASCATSDRWYRIWFRCHISHASSKIYINLFLFKLLRLAWVVVLRFNCFVVKGGVYFDGRI